MQNNTDGGNSLQFLMKTKCLVFNIAAHLGNKVIVYQLLQLTLQVTVNSCNKAQTISARDCIESRKHVSHTGNRQGNLLPC